MEPPPLTAFEQARQELIARNRARLVALGIPEAVAGLNKLLVPNQQQRPKPQAPKPRAPRAPKAEPEPPTRWSARLREPKGSSSSSSKKGSQYALPEGVEEGSELAMFIIDGECPRCGRLLQRGHAPHLQRCQGPVEVTEEEAAAQAARYGEVQAARLRQLELGGLVDYTPASPGDPDTGAEPSPACATFIVIGSTGNHYVVKLTEPKFTCTCLDHRFRKHNCKHIKLLLQQLGAADDHSIWEQGLEGQVDGFRAAEEEDVAMVQEANARAAARSAKAAAKRAAEEAAAAAAEPEANQDAARGKRPSKQRRVGKQAAAAAVADDQRQQRDQGAPVVKQEQGAAPSVKVERAMWEPAPAGKQQQQQAPAAVKVEPADAAGGRREQAAAKDAQKQGAAVPQQQQQSAGGPRRSRRTAADMAGVFM